MEHKLLNRNMIEFGILIILYRVMCDVAYKFIILRDYAHLFYKDNSSVLTMILSWVMMLAVSPVIYLIWRDKDTTISGLVMLIISLMYVVPFTTMFAFGQVRNGFVIFNIVYWAAFYGVYFLVHRFIGGSNPIKPVKKAEELITKRQSDYPMMFLALFFGLVVIYLAGRYGGFRLIFDILDVYEYRYEMKGDDIPTVLSYFLSWSGTVNAILGCYFIIRKKYVWTVFCFEIQLISFGYTGLKTTLFLFVAAVIISFLPKIISENVKKWILRGFAGCSAACLAVFAVIKNSVPASLFFRRMMFFPVQISDNYYDFFTSHEPDFFRQSFLRYFGFTSPYPEIQYMIGDAYYSPEISEGIRSVYPLKEYTAATEFPVTIAHANTGLISDAIVNLGIAGLIVFPILLVIVLKLLDVTSVKLDLRIVLAVSLYVTFMLQSSFLFTVLLTHGVMITIVIMAFMRRGDAEKDAESKDKPKIINAKEAS